jgi:hypothetical protein
MDYIGTWFCGDKKGEESLYYQTGLKSSSSSHQNIYWRCVVVFYITSRRFNSEHPHVFFTNVDQMPVIEGKDVYQILQDLEVEIRFTDFKYKTPANYHHAFKNQFYEFSILEDILHYNPREEDQYMILDSDCIFVKPVHVLFDVARDQGFLSFAYSDDLEVSINGLRRKDMQLIYEELLSTKLETLPEYHLGEFFLCSVKNIRKIVSDFQKLWPELLRRNELGLPKFNEEAHTLSYLYFINELQHCPDDQYLKRIWTNPVFYRNVEKGDEDLFIWHLPSEKRFGIEKLYHLLVNKRSDYGRGLDDEAFSRLLQKKIGIPKMGLGKYLNYYLLTYTRSASKRIKNLAGF